MPSTDKVVVPENKSDLEARIDAVRRAMAGYPGLPPSQRALAFLVCTGDAAPQTFNKIVKGVNAPSTDALHSLHHALRLHEIGLEFDVRLWKLPYTAENLAASVREHRAAKAHEPLIARVTGRLPLFGFEVNRARVFAPIEDAGPRYVDPFPRTAFRKGENVRVWIHAAIDGYVKLVSLEKGDAIGLDSYFALSHKKFRQGDRLTLQPAFKAQPDPPDALFVAIMQPERFQPPWPTHHQGHRMSETQFAELLRALPGNSPIWAHRVFVAGEDHDG